MNQIIDILELEGKTIEKTYSLNCGEILVIVFTDGKYAVYVCVHGYDNDYDIELSPDADAIYDCDKCEIGLISKEELDSIQNENKRKRAESEEISERRVYEKLKLRFEGKP